MSSHLSFQRVGVLPRNDKAQSHLKRLRDLFSRASMELIVLGEDDRPDPAPDLVIALGGDGTVLHALTAFPHTPILPINFGTVGFLGAGGEEEFEKLIFRLLADEFFVEERMMLASRYKDRRTEVVNEVVLKGTTKMVLVDLVVDGEPIHSIRGDGIIVGTPTGSTSYLMSTGSPIVAPQVDCIIVNGINEHRFASRSLILPAASKIRLKVDEKTRETELFLSHDGRDKVSIQAGDEVEIERAARPARLVYFERDTFFRNLKGRLDW